MISKYVLLVYFHIPWTFLKKSYDSWREKYFYRNTCLIPAQQGSSFHGRGTNLVLINQCYEGKGKISCKGTFRYKYWIRDNLPQLHFFSFRRCKSTSFLYISSSSIIYANLGTSLTYLLRMLLSLKTCIGKSNHSLRRGYNYYHWDRCKFKDLEVRFLDSITY